MKSRRIGHRNQSQDRYLSSFFRGDMQSLYIAIDMIPLANKHSAVGKTCQQRTFKQN
jgi:hypothetical protein